MIKMSMTNISGMLLGFFLIIDNILLPEAGLAHKDFVQTKFRGNFVTVKNGSDFRSLVATTL